MATRAYPASSSGAIFPIILALNQCQVASISLYFFPTHFLPFYQLSFPYLINSYWI